MGGSVGIGGAGGAPADLPDVTGCFAMAIQTPVAPDNPLMLLALAQLVDVNAHGGTLRLSLAPTAPSPLPSTTCEPAGFEPGDAVGEPIVLADIHVNPDGTFSTADEHYVIEGCGNAISGSLIEAQLVLEGVTVTADRFCGITNGRATKPFPLDFRGSAWAAVRMVGTVDDGCSGARDAWRAAPPIPDLACEAPRGSGGNVGGAGGAG